MADAIKTVYTYNLDGTKKDFNVPFEYLARKFVRVTLIGKDRKILVLNQDYRFASKTTITTTQAWGQAQGYSYIEVRRYTSATERLIDYTDGSILRAYDLNISQLQTIHVAEEARDLTADTIGVNNDGELDARGRRIVNLVDATHDRDAVTFGQVKQMSNGAWNARNQAEAFKNQAQGFRNEAEVSRNAAEAAKARAGASELKAKDWASKANGQVVEGGLYSAMHYANASKTSADASARSQTAAAESQRHAANSQAAAATSQTGAAKEAQFAKEWASKPRNQVVGDNLYSARHYAEVAKEESGKLGNMNALAGAIQNVSGTNVDFKGAVTVNSFQVRSQGVELYGNTPFIDFHYGNDAGDYTHRIITTADAFSFTRNIGVSGNVHASGQLTGTQVNLPNGAYVNSSSSRKHSRNTTSRYVDTFVWDGNNRGVVMEWGSGYGSGQGYLMFLQRQNENAKAELSVNGSISAATNVNAGGQLIAHAASDGFRLESPRADQASYLLSRTAGQNEWYVGKGGAGHEVTLHSYKLNTNIVLTANSINANRTLISAGEVQAGSGKARFAADGNIYGSQWGNQWLRQFLDNTYKHKNAGWTVVWQGGALGGGASANLSQDVRWKTIWLRIGGGENRYMPVKVGPDGQYYVGGWGDGWLKFQIYNNGRGFKNIQDKTTVPTQIVVENV